tara:strand:- start:51 stop:929 length:879 start_codon:yes stop_codon:yes gene_type:complete
MLLNNQLITRGTRENLIMRKTPICSFEPLPLTGLDIGIPLNIIENVFTNIHYGENIVTIKQLLIQFLIGYYTYGKDRYVDALAYNTTPNQFNITAKKKELYENFNNNKVFYKLSYDITFSLIAYLLLTQSSAYENLNIQMLNTGALPFMLLLYSSEYYRELKRITPLAKSLYVSFMWTISTIILPGYLYEHNYNILYDIGCYLPCFLSLFATTNLADIKDVEEDTINKVKTIPVCYGVEETKMLILISLAISSLIFGLNQHYIDRPIINSLYELQNIGIALIIQFSNNTQIV